MDEAGVNSILVGDSLGNVMLGYKDTVSVTMEDMIHHRKAVSRGVKNALLIIDSAWSDVDFNHLRELKSCEVKIIPVVYDLIPISYPEYCSEDFVSLFEYWIKNILDISNKFIKPYVDKFKKIVPIEYKKVLQEEKMEAINKKIAQVERDY